VRLLLLSSALQPIKEKFELREIIRVEIAVVAEKMVKFDPKIPTIRAESKTAALGAADGGRGTRI
jgi:hypothetical protein